METNVLGTVNLVQACLETGFEVLVNTGSSSEYGWKDHAPAETDWLEPNSCYAVAKASATLFCRQTAQATRAVIPHFVSTRSTVRMRNQTASCRLWWSTAWRALSLRWRVHGHFSRLRIGIDDAVDGFLSAATMPHAEPGAVYNLGTGLQTTLRQVVEVATGVFRYQATPVWGSHGESNLGHHGLGSRQPQDSKSIEVETPDWPP